jgi:hypothetical protein
MENREGALMMPTPTVRTATQIFELNARARQIALDASVILARVEGGIAANEAPQLLIDQLRLLDHDLRNALTGLPAIVWTMYGDHDDA